MKQLTTIYREFVGDLRFPTVGGWRLIGQLLEESLSGMPEMQVEISSQAK